MTRVQSYIPERPVLVFVAEAPGDTEVSQARRAELGLAARIGPLRGPSGHRHEAVLRTLGVDREECAHINVVETQFPAHNGVNNSLDGFLVRGADLAQAQREATLGTGPNAELAVRQARLPVRENRYFPPAHYAELRRLYEELQLCVRRGATVAVLYGELALWALTGRSAISAARGAVTPTCVAGLLAVPTYHPANTFHQESNLQHVRNDVELALRISQGANAHFVQPIVRVPRSLADLRELLDRYVEPFEPLAFDLETSPIGTSRADFYVRSVQVCGDDLHGIVIPFEDKRVPNGLFWSAADHATAWKWCVHYMMRAPGVWHNGVNFDGRVLSELHEVRIAVLDDTMVECQVRWPGAGATLHDAAVRLVPGTHVWKKDRRG